MNDRKLHKLIFDFIKSIKECENKSEEKHYMEREKNFQTSMYMKNIGKYKKENLLDIPMDASGNSPIIKVECKFSESDMHELSVRYEDWAHNRELITMAYFYRNVADLLHDVEILERQIKRRDFSNL